MEKKGKKKFPSSSPELPGNAYPALVSHVPQKYIYLSYLTLFVLVFLLYSNTIKHDYVLDDIAVITKNKIVQQGISGIPVLLKTGFYYGYFGYNNNLYRPLPLITFAIGQSVWGNNPGPEHLINIILFALAAILVFKTFRLLLGNANWLIAFVIAILFSAHPIHTEVVANIKSRDEILAFIFSLLSLNMSVHFILNKKMPALVIAGISLFLAMLSKESAITFILIIPLSLYFMDAYAANENEDLKIIRGRKLAASSMAVLAVIAYLLIRFALFYHDQQTTSQVKPLDNVMSNLDFFERLPTAILVLGRYLWLLLMPHPLVFDYSFSELTVANWDDARVIASFLVYSNLTLLGLSQLGKKKFLGFGIFLFLISVMVISNIPLTIGTGMAERLLFTPSLGFCIVSGIMIFKFTGASGYNISDPRFIWRIVPVVFILAGLYGFKTISRNGDWKNQLTLFRADVKNSPRSARIHYSLGNQLLEEGKLMQDPDKQKKMYDEAEIELKKTLNIYPQYAEAIIALANLYQEKGDFVKADEYLARVSSTNIGAAGAGREQLLYNKANALLGLKDYRQAVNYYQQALAINPEMSEGYINMGLAYKGMNRIDSAIIAMKKGIQINPKSAEAYLNLGTCYSVLNDYESAILNFKKSLAINPDFAEVYINLGDLYNRTNKPADAEKALRKAYELKPLLPEASFNLGYFYIQKKDYNSAFHYLIESQQLRPDYIDALINISFCASQLGRYQDVIDYALKGIAIRPDLPDLYYNVAYGYEKSGNRAKAVEYKKLGDAIHK